MECILGFYLRNKDWIDLIKDLVFLLGAFGVVRYLITWNYKSKVSQIERDLNFRDNLEHKLQDYVLEKHKNDIKDIGIRFIYWKNYPWSLENDAFKHYLFVRSFDNNVMPSGWIDKTGINFQKHFWHSSTSIYVDANGIFFFAPENGSYIGFKELKNKCLVKHMPFSNIVNYDFREYIEYEPVFYIKYPYTKYKKLYDSQYIVREKLDDNYFQEELKGNLQIKKPNCIKHHYLRLKFFIFAFH